MVYLSTVKMFAYYLHLYSTKDLKHIFTSLEQVGVFINCSISI